jgi:spore germination protein
VIIHVVKSGDTMASVAAEYGADPELAAKENGIGLSEPLVVGQTIVIQIPDKVHIAEAGDTLTSVAERYGVSTGDIYRNNRWLKGQPLIRAGEALVITYFRQPLGSAAFSGYAYPFIDRSLLSGELPYLTYLTPFTYGISEDGGLELRDDEKLLSLAGNYGVSPLMHLSTLTENGNFSSERAAALLSDESMQAKLLDAAAANIQAKGYAGLDIDFEFIPGSAAKNYALFVASARERLAPLGKSVTVALAPKTSASQKGLLYEGHDYALLGSAADYVFLMTYEWGYTYGEPMAVAPLPNVRAVLDYALTEIPPTKIFIGIPNYGYDWKLPYEKGKTRAQSISNERAVMIAAQYASSIEFDETAKAPYFYYTDEYDSAHAVWFEDARSVRAKLALVAEYALRGAGYWNLDRPFPQNWLVLNDMYDIKKETD